MTTTVLAIPGDGIGPEVVPAAVRVLDTCDADLEILHGDAGADVLATHGRPIHPDTVPLLDDADCVLFGAATTTPGRPSTVLALRRALGIDVAVRPARTIAGVGTPGFDVTVVRELTEDLYVQEERAIAGGAEATSRITEAATRRAAQVACDVAQRRGTAGITIAHKATVLPATQGLFLRAATEIANRHGVAAVGRLADSLAHDLVRGVDGPQVILAPNVFGDLLSDVASALAGGLGLAPSASYGTRAALFEPVHGSAPDIAGRGVANPTAAILSAALLLDHVGATDAAVAVRRAVEAVLADAAQRTPDLGGANTTAGFTDRVVDALGAEVVA